MRVDHAPDAVLPSASAFGAATAAVPAARGAVVAHPFLAEALRRLREGSGGTGSGFVGATERRQYARYARNAARPKGKFVVHRHDDGFRTANASPRRLGAGRGPAAGDVGAPQCTSTEGPRNGPRRER
jgi:hypothetical protein